MGDRSDPSGSEVIPALFTELGGFGAVGLAMLEPQKAIAAQMQSGVLDTLCRLVPLQSW
jgi:hypothetical protein